jgi:hypothetical protein
VVGQGPVSVIEQMVKKRRMTTEMQATPIRLNLRYLLSVASSNTSLDVAAQTLSSLVQLDTVTAIMDHLEHRQLGRACIGSAAEEDLRLPLLGAVQLHDAVHLLADDAGLVTHRLPLQSGDQEAQDAPARSYGLTASVWIDLKTCDETYVRRRAHHRHPRLPDGP